MTSLNRGVSCSIAHTLPHALHLPKQNRPRFVHSHVHTRVPDLLRCQVDVGQEHSATTQAVLFEGRQETIGVPPLPQPHRIRPPVLTYHRVAGVATDGEHRTESLSPALALRRVTRGIH